MKTIIKAETKEKQEQVLTILEKQGYVWQSSEKPTDVIPYERIGEDLLLLFFGFSFYDCFHVSPHRIIFL